MTVDEELGLVYLPVEDPTSDYYGGHRPGNNLFGDSLVCVDLRTGQRKWHFQVVHHPIWDFDLSSAPILADINVGGRAIKAVALPSKQAFLYTFDRVTGQPVWPIEEKPVQQSDVPGEKTSPTQPIPTKPPAYARNFLRVPDDLIDYTPEMRAQAKDLLSRYRVAGIFNPPLAGDEKGLLGAINVGNAGGGTNWPGAGYDPETHIVYAQAANSSASGLSVRKPPAGFSDMNYFSGRGDQPFREALGPGFGTAADSPLAKTVGRPQPPPPPGAPAPAFGLNVQGLPIMKPPYGVISAINLDRGELQWQVPYGETPDNVRNILTQRGIKFENTGQNGSVGLLVTKTLVILGDNQVTSITHPRGAMLRAYDKATGKEVGAVWMPSPQSGSPMTYMANGKQYIVIAVSGGAYSGEYLAFSLPETD
jgi:quinoprotein glucose dehydrogenase